MTHDSTVRRLRSRLALCVAAAAIALTAIQPANPGLLAQSADSPKFDPALAARLATATPGTPLEVIVVFSDVGAASGVQALATRFHRMQFLPMAGAILTADQIRTIAGWSEVSSITLNAPLKYFLHESVPLIRADQVWTTYGQTGGNVTVAVIDSGIDATHPDLQAGAKVIQNVKVLPYELSLENMAVTDTTSGHGTHVAGTIGGSGAASSGYYRGVAPDVKLVGLGAGEGLSILTATQAYDWVLQHHAEYNIRVVSNSWGSTGGDINLRNPITIATLTAYEKGILSVFAAGNDGAYDVMNPYSLAPWVLSVAAGKKDGTLTDFSSRGQDGDYFKHPDITAPGHNIIATRTKTIGITAADPYPNLVNPLYTAAYTVMSGTSMATPHVSGAAALLFSGNPQLSPDQVMNLLTQTATPMPAYKLHEAGYGYLDALKAYEAGRGVAGELPAFLSGQRQHSMAEVIAFDPDEPTPHEQVLEWEGITAAGASGLPDHIDLPFTAGEGTLYVDAQVTWTPQLEDAYDIEIRDSLDRVVVSSGNGLDAPEAVLFVPDAPGEYRLRLIPFAAVATQYHARVRIASGTAPPGTPTSGPPAYDRYLSVAAIFKTHGVLGIEGYRFRSGDSGFINFSLTKPDGQLELGAAAHLTAAYADRHGNIVRVDNAIRDLGGGVYRTSFNTAAASEPWAAGPITVFFTWRGPGTMRAAPTNFVLNGLDVSLHTAQSSYTPGAAIAFSGDVVMGNTVAIGTVEMVRIGAAQVTIRLVDATGAALASTAVPTDVEGRYTGALTAPPGTRGPTTLIAEATYRDPTITAGTPNWHGAGTRALRFPGNMAPTATLAVTREAGAKSNQFYAAIDGAVRDLDGRADVTGIALTIVDAKGRTIRRWTAADFTAADDNTWRFNRVTRVSGAAPWTVTLTAQDTAGQAVTKTQTIQ